MIHYHHARKSCGEAQLIIHYSSEQRKPRPISDQTNHAVYRQTWSAACGVSKQRSSSVSNYPAPLLLHPAQKAPPTVPTNTVLEWQEKTGCPILYLVQYLRPASLGQALLPGPLPFEENEPLLLCKTYRIHCVKPPPAKRLLRKGCFVSTHGTAHLQLIYISSSDHDLDLSEQIYCMICA